MSLLLSLIWSLALSPATAEASSLLSCRTENGLEIILDSKGRSSGVAKYGDGNEIWDLAPDEYVSIELLHGRPCYRLELRQIAFNRSHGVLEALCLNSGNTYIFELPLACEPRR
jgi:hypothetical protein